jgi:hypothetical protein
MLVFRAGGGAADHERGCARQAMTGNKPVRLRRAAAWLRGPSTAVIAAPRPAAGRQPYLRRGGSGS